jgi:hypothetical protein
VPWTWKSAAVRGSLSFALSALPADLVLIASILRSTARSILKVPSTKMPHLCRDLLSW